MLNLEKALILGQILETYIDEKSMEKSPIDFIAHIIERIQPREYLKVLVLLTNKTEEELSKQLAIDTLTQLIEGLKENQIIALVSFYKSLGFK